MTVEYRNELEGIKYAYLDNEMDLIDKECFVVNANARTCTICYKLSIIMAKHSTVTDEHVKIWGASFRSQTLSIRTKEFLSAMKQTQDELYLIVLKEKIYMTTSRNTYIVIIDNCFIDSGNSKKWMFLQKNPAM